MKIVLVSLLIFFCQVSQAQQQHACGHAEMEELLLQKHPALLHERAALEQFTATYTAHRQQRVLSDTILFIIPVVFHIMHNYGEENISREQIVDAVRIMNEYYQKRNADTAQIIPLFQPLIGDVRLEFRLAQLDPQGNCTDGITRHQTYLTNGGNDLLKSILQWPPDRYLNIWVEKNTLNSFSAYAYLPGAPPALDGIVVTHPYVGSIGTAQGSSSIAILAHEAGHYFNLLHTWGPTNTPGLASNCSLDDQVFDTPNCIGGVCNLNAPGCIAGETSNVQNIMDYCFEQMFTLGQVTRMQAALNAPTGNRNNLWSTGNLALTGTNDGYIPVACPPIADLTNRVMRICEGQSITFENLSYGGNVDSVEWQFTGGNIVSSTDPSPTVQYPVAGIYDVVLTVFNGSGSSSIVRNGLVNVLPAVPSLTAPVTQDFESLQFPSGAWGVENAAGSAWEITTNASVSGSHSIFLQRDSLNRETDDVIYTESYDFSNCPSPTFSFRLAFANVNASGDVLKIFMSTDCGQTWNMRYSKSGSFLATATDTAYFFIPSSGQWRQDGANINGAAGEAQVCFKFQFTSKGGNSIYVDDINIGGLPVKVQTMEDVDLIQLKPNPAYQQAILILDLPLSANISYTILDVAGRAVRSNDMQLLTAGKHAFEISRPPAAGLYFLLVRVNDQLSLRKLVFE